MPSSSARTCVSSMRTCKKGGGKGEEDEVEGARDGQGRGTATSHSRPATPCYGKPRAALPSLLRPAPPPPSAAPWPSRASPRTAPRGARGPARVARGQRAERATARLSRTTPGGQLLAACAAQHREPASLPRLASASASPGAANAFCCSARYSRSSLTRSPLERGQGRGGGRGGGRVWAASATRGVQRRSRAGGAEPQGCSPALLTAAPGAHLSWLSRLSRSCTRMSSTLSRVISSSSLWRGREGRERQGRSGAGGAGQGRARDRCDGGTGAVRAGRGHATAACGCACQPRPYPPHLKRLRCSSCSSLCVSSSCA
jgi:hypothetical protein